MNVWRLLWALLKHALHGRGRDEVYVTVNLGPHGPLTGRAFEFDWVGDDDAFCLIHAREQA